MVRPTGLEPVRCYSLEPESSASANSATRAKNKQPDRLCAASQHLAMQPSRQQRRLLCQNSLPRQDDSQNSQPPGASEHQTGLAIDMSNVNSLNESNAEIVSQIKAIAPGYGFVLRFESDKQDSTGIGYEDWHYRYVGVESAKYMTEHNLSLEEYLNVLKENGK